jgi:hypothetical protein
MECFRESTRMGPNTLESIDLKQTLKKEREFYIAAMVTCTWVISSIIYSMEREFTSSRPEPSSKVLSRIMSSMARVKTSY